CCRVHRYLHSFPTRRSSDLVRRALELAMQVLYEEEGELKVGAVLGQAPASLHVESPHGRRSKIKAANVLLEFERPAGLELLAQRSEEHTSELQSRGHLVCRL